MSPIRLTIVDDHELVRIGLRSVAALVHDIEVVGDYDNAQDALDEAQKMKPDVILMDVRMPGIDGVEACRRIRDIVPSVNVLMLTSYNDEHAVESSIMAGAAGYLIKRTSGADLLHAVRAAAKGESLLDPAITRRVLDKLKALTTTQKPRDTPVPSDEDGKPRLAALSKREHEVFVLIVEGCTNREIRKRLFISENTARNHVSHILHKLRLARRGQIAAVASRRALAAD